MKTESFRPVYTKRQHQGCNNSAILFSLKSMGSLENWVKPHSGLTPLFPIKTVSLVSLQSCRSTDSDAWCKWALIRYISIIPFTSKWFELKRPGNTITNITGGRINYSKIIRKCFFLFDIISTFICHILTFSEELSNMLFMIITDPLFLRRSREVALKVLNELLPKRWKTQMTPTIDHIMVIKMFPFVSSLIQTLVTTGFYNQMYPESATFILFSTDRMVPCFT